MRRPLAAALVLGTVNLLVFGLLSRVAFFPATMVLAAAPIALWLACVATAYLVLAAVPHEPLSGKAALRLVEWGALAGLVLGLLAATAFFWGGRPRDALFMGSLFGAPLGAVAGALCALVDVALLAGWTRALRR